MFDWLRRWLWSTKVAPAAERPTGTPFRWPDEVHQAVTSADMEATLRPAFAVVYISVDWAMQAAQSRRTFAEFVERFRQEYSEIAAWFGVMSEHSEGVHSWFESLALPASAASGYGAVVWLRHGRLVGLVPYAAEVGAEGLVRRTLELWKNTEQ